MIGDILVPDKAAQMLEGRTVEGRETLLADTICFVRTLEAADVIKRMSNVP